MNDCSIWTILAAIGNIAMAFVALFAYLHSLTDAKAKIVIDLKVKKALIHGTECKLWCLRISNIGKLPAKDFHISFDKSFIDNIPLNNDISRLDFVKNKTLQIRGGAEFYYVIAPINANYTVFDKLNDRIDKWLKEYRSKPINVYYSYNGDCIDHCESLIIEQYDTQNFVFLND